MSRLGALLAGLCLPVMAVCQDRADIRINAGKPGHSIASTLHGVFFEEISHAGEGGLYAELIQNRGFEESRLPPGTTLENGFIIPPRTPHFSMANNGVSDWKMEWPLTSQWPAWSTRRTGQADIALSLTEEHPLNPATPHSLRVDMSKVGPLGTAELVNEGFWGIGVKEGAEYSCSFYIRTAGKYVGGIRVMLMGANGRMLAMQTIKNIHNEDWKQYRCVLKAVGGDTAASFHLAFDQPGTVWLDMVSLFPAETFRGRPNGLRKDLAEYIAALKPAFVRWPGGCFVEGIDIQSAPDWRTTIGPVEGRTGTYSPWGYWSSDGFGYHEYLQFCEDIGAAALYVCNAGVSCDFRSGTFVPDDSVSEYVQRALDAIEYAIGPVDSKWGRIRAASGHPRPFPLKYIEIGNEQSGPRYAKRFNQFYTAIKARYPGIEVIAAMGIGDVNRHTLDSMRKLDIADEHAYKAAYWAMGHYDHFDKYHRGDWDLYVGEYATNSGVGKGNMEAALSDAVYIMSMEKNGDLVKMSSYAPMLVNVHDEDWPVNLIHFDAARSFGRISYYAVKMLSAARADVNLPVQTQLMAAPRRGPAFAGGIGLGTWDTQAEYKDIEVSQEGKVVYRSDLAGGVGGWSFVRGQWSLRDSALAQTGEGAQHLAILNGRSFDTYTLRLRARKLGGYNAFIIPFAVKDTNTCYRAHIGSWWNSHCTIEKLTNGYDVTDLIEQQKLKRPIETGRWYDIRLEVGKDTVKCWLDDELVMVYREPVKVFALAGRKGDDLIIKVVNAAGLPCKGMLHIDGATQIGQTGELTTLSAERADAENSFADPQKYIPVVTPITGIGSDFEKLFPPYSISIIKIKAK